MMIKIFYTKVGKCSIPPSMLSEYRRQKHSGDALNAAAELLTVYALRDFGYAPALPLDIHTAENGKPYIPNAPFFNLSHSGDFVIIAVSEKPVGIDIQEPVAPERAQKIARRFFTLEEQELTARFTELWTRKEAYIKFTGIGLSAMLSAFSVLGDLPGCHFKSSVLEGCFYSVCAEEKCTAQPVFVDAEELLNGI